MPLFSQGKDRCSRCRNEFVRPEGYTLKTCPKCREYKRQQTKHVRDPEWAERARLRRLEKEKDRKCKKCSVKIGAYMHICYECKKENISQYKKEYRRKNRDRLLEKDRKRYRENKEFFRYKHKEWIVNHKDEIREYMNKYEKERKRNDPIFYLQRNLRDRVRKAVKKEYKKTSASELVGCNIKELKDYLEGLFQPGMTWENHGFYGWHIDHIKPLCSFDLTNIEEQRKAFHYTNLQPLWAKENFKKSGKTIGGDFNSVI